MKFTKFGKALLISALSAGVILSVTSCVQSYTVGYLYVTGTATSESNGNGIISGFKIDHNTGKLIPINGLPVSSGGANPVRAVLLNSSRFLYVLNRGVNAEGGSDCTTLDPCTGSNITQLAVGANGILTVEEIFYTQGVNPFRMIADPSNSFIYVLDHDSPDNSAPTANDGCAKALSGVTSCGDITAFAVNQVTGRLQLVVNAQVTSASGAALTYFPVPANPIDFVLTSSYVLTLNGTPATGDTVFPYQFTSTTGQLTVSSNSSDAIGNVQNATAIVSAGNYTYVLDNDPITFLSNGNLVTSASQIIPYSLGNGGSLTTATSGPIPDDPNLSNPIFLVVEHSNAWLYVANYGLNTQNSPQSGIAGYILNGVNAPTVISGSPFGTGGGPQCLVEDPSYQYFYAANFNDSTVTGEQVDVRSGLLRPLSDSTKAPNSYPLTGPPTWCLVDGRTG